MHIFLFALGYVSSLNQLILIFEKVICRLKTPWKHCTPLWLLTTGNLFLKKHAHGKMYCVFVTFTSISGGMDMYSNHRRYGNKRIAL